MNLNGSDIEKSNPSNHSIKYDQYLALKQLIFINNNVNYN